MITHEYTFRVNYSDTDKMGVVHHSNYARYCENARWELFRKIGIPYDDIEEMGYMLPVFLMNSSFIAPAHYDDELRIVTVLEECKGVRITFTFRLFNEKNIPVNETEIVLACVDKDTFKPCPIPPFITEGVESYLFRQTIEDTY